MIKTLSLTAFCGAIVFTSKVPATNGFLSLTSTTSRQSHLCSTTSRTAASELAETKAKLLNWVRPKSYIDPVLCDPITREPLEVSITTPTTFESSSHRTLNYVLKSSSDTYIGSSDTYIDLLEPEKVTDDKSIVGMESERKPATLRSMILRAAAPFIPPPFRQAVDQDYVPMRDLFTSPAVSFAYERGWRQAFQRAGFPGADREAQMAMDYFEPAITDDSRVVDMSCATGLFTRRFAQSGRYKLVLGCDYSSSMLQEARRRLERDRAISRRTKVELIRLDVGKIPMRDNSIDALHAGAAMHCWPDLPAAVSEIHRVLQPGGRYFATTFLSSYFSNLRSMQGDVGPSQQAFQYFVSVDQLRALLEDGGFKSENISIDVLGAACVVIRCEK
jgi:ubiquinone/menaquinone biosynthesis C-methylase UbiE